MRRSREPGLVDTTVKKEAPTCVLRCGGRWVCRGVYRAGLHAARPLRRESKTHELGGRCTLDSRAHANCLLPGAEFIVFLLLLSRVVVIESLDSDRAARFGGQTYFPHPG